MKTLMREEKTLMREEKGKEKGNALCEEQHGRKTRAATCFACRAAAVSRHGRRLCVTTAPRHYASDGPHDHGMPPTLVKVQVHGKAQKKASSGPASWAVTLSSPESSHGSES